MMIGTFITSEGESLKNLKQRMKLRGAKVFCRRVRSKSAAGATPPCLNSAAFLLLEKITTSCGQQVVTIMEHARS